MSIMELLGLILGLAALSGINLYLTVFLTGLAIRFDLFHLATQYQALGVLGYSLVLAVSGFLLLMEFFADKIPWVDSLWDTVHTLIRPLGAALIGLQIVGDLPAYLQVLAIVTTAGIAFTTHAIKASIRLTLNQSPAPATNITASLIEDALVVGGVALVLLHPVIALGVVGVMIVFCWLLFPKILRAAKATARFAWHKLQMPGRQIRHQASSSKVNLPRHIDNTLKDVLLLKGDLSAKEVRATIPCLTGKSRGIRGLASNLAGLLIFTQEMKHYYFATTKGLRYRLFRVPIEGRHLIATVESAFLSENLVLESDQMRMTLRFNRDESALVDAIAELLKQYGPKPNLTTSTQETTQRPLPEKPILDPPPSANRKAIAIEVPVSSKSEISSIPASEIPTNVTNPTPSEKPIPSMPSTSPEGESTDAKPKSSEEK